MTASSNSILIVDPDPELSSQLSDELSQDDYRVTSVHTGREAMAHLQYFPDLIILDPLLPDMNGLDLLRSIKQSPELYGFQLFIIRTKEKESDEKNVNRLKQYNNIVPYKGFVNGDHIYF